MAELTPKREAFAKNFIENGGNATDAARKAGYKKPEQEGCRLLKNADVSAYIADKQAELDRRNGTDTMSLADIQKRRAMIARGEAKDSFGFTPAFSEQLKAMSDLEKAITIKEQKEAQQKAAEAARAAGEYHLDLDIIARMIFSLLPVKTGLVLSMDRTNWKFGEFNINILMLGITYKGIAFPLIFSLLPKRGNSSWNERRKIMERFIRLFGAECIDSLVADREFIGKEWTGWLNSRRIRYYIRIRQNFWIVKPSTGERIRAWWLFNDLKVGQEKFFHKLFLHKGEYVYLAGSRIKNSDGVPELQILICFNRPEGAILTYKKRWEIETAFRAMKSSGFNIEDTHMRDMERIARLVAMVCVALVWAYLVGEHKDINIKPIRILKHGRKAKSLVKYGLEEIATILLRPAYTPKFDVFKFLSCT